MTTLDVTLSLVFMGMFTVALLAAMGSVNGLTRGYTCRVISTSTRDEKPERGCMGQSDEVSVDSMHSINLQNRFALETLKSDLQRFALTRTILKGGDSLRCLSLKTRVWNAAGKVDPLCFPAGGLDLSDEKKLASSYTVFEKDEALRASALEQRCLWEKLEPVGGKMKAYRNHLVIDYEVDEPGGALKLVAPSEKDSDPLPSVQNEGGHGKFKHFWFIRGGRLVGERRIYDPEEELYVSTPVPGLQGVPDEWLSRDVPDQSRPTGFRALSYLEAANETLGGTDEIWFAPNTSWGNLNQVCLYQSFDLPGLFLLSAQRGKDLGGLDSSKGLFGRLVKTGGAAPPSVRTVFFID